MKNIKIFIAAHKKTPIIESDVFTPIHVGRAIANEDTKENLDHYVGDDSGENISYKNSQYAELTALYWGWKNLPKNVEYVGLMHYSRFFNFSDKQYTHPENIFSNLSLETISKFCLDSKTINTLCDKYDLIVPEKWEMRKEHIEYEHKRYGYDDDNIRRKLNNANDVLNMYEHYALTHIKDDMDIAVGIIKKDYPNISKFVDESLACTKARFTNMFIMKRELFDGYCAFLFDIFSKMEQRKNYSTSEKYVHNSFQGRVFGFLSERLFSIYTDFLISQKKVTYQERQIVFADYTASVSTNKTEEQSINIVMSCDDNYAPYLAVAINSIIRNHGKEQSLIFHILDGGIKRNNKKKIKNFVNSLNSKIEFINIDLKKFEETCPLTDDVNHITLPTYFRFSIANLLPKTLDRVLYLDVDLLVKSNLEELYSTEFENYYAVVVEDTFIASEKIVNNLQLHGKYFNAGVMLINLKKWREENLEHIFFTNTKKIREKIVFVDQDVMNYTLDERVKYVSYNWNLQQTAYHMTKKHLDYIRLEADKKNPYIIHYSGHIKPWDSSFHCWHPLAGQYLDYWKTSPYKNSYYRFKLKKHLFSLLHKLLNKKFEYYHLRRKKLRGVLFDDRFYLNTYADILNDDIDPLLHYCQHGWKEGRNPSPEFDTTFYLNSNPDVRKSRINPLFHYLVYGMKEQRKPHE